MRIVAVAMNTFREAVRDKVLYVLLFFAGATIMGSKALGWVSVGQDEKIIIDISLAATSLFGVLIAVFVGTSLVYKEIDKRTIYTIISRPMWRHEFVLGKYLGLAMLIAVVTLVMAAMAAAYIAIMGGHVGLTYLQAVFLIYCQLLLITALSVLLSSIASPILGVIIVFSCYVLGHATGIMINLPPRFEGTVTKEIFETAYYIIPNLSHFNIRAEAANGVPVPGLYVLWTTAYGAAYTVLLLVLAAFAFENKDV